MTDEQRNSTSEKGSERSKFVDPADRIAAEITGISEPEDALPPITLDNLPEKISGACVRAGWNKLMPVQAHAIPYQLAKRDIMVQSRTGSGKTGTYLLPALDRIDPSRKHVQMLVLVPTRELAIQVEHEAGVLFKDSGIQSCAVYGGVGYGKQVEKLQKGAHVVIGTPGRVLDHLIRHTMDLSRAGTLVFDEADRMLSIGFYPDMVEIKGYLPRSRSTFLLSATYPPRVIQLAGEFMHKPSMLSLSHQQVHVVDTPHVFYNAKPMDKDRVLIRVLEVENPSSAIIFCNTKANVHYVTAVLKGFGYDVDELSADLSQSKREQVLKKLREGRVRFLVATDVAARGIDIPELSHVILYEPPEDRESYIHRAGRTGRAGASGEVISLVDIMQKLELQRIGTYYKISLQERETPSDEDVAKVAGLRVTTMLEARLRAKNALEKERMKRFVPLLKDLAQDEEQLLLAAQLLDELYQQTLHTPPPAPEKKQGQQKNGDNGSQRKEQNQQRRHSRPRRRKPKAAE